MFLLLLLACRSLGELDGSDLGNPESSVYGYDDAGDVMVVFSDLPDLCSLLSQGTAPDGADWWVVSARTVGGAKEEHELPVRGFASIRLFGQDTRYTATEGTLWIDEAEENQIEGELHLEFPTEDTLSNQFQATWCSAPLFVGLESE